MTPKKINFKSISHDRYTFYLDKAMEFFEAMVDASQKKNWNAAGLAGVHCCISATDALLVKHAGIRSSSYSHQDVVGLLSAKINDPDTSRQAKRLGEILAQKNLIEYVDKSFPEKHAQALKISVERYLEWVRKLL